MKRTASTLGALILCLLATSISAYASRKPTGKERGAILKVARRHGASCSGVVRFYPPGTKCRQFIRVSTVSRRWAALYLRGEVQREVVDFHRFLGRWHYHSVHADCTIPTRVGHDLEIDCF